MTAITPDEEDIYTALRAFLLDVLPSGVEVFQGQVNRVPEPVGEDFVIMTIYGPLKRLATNEDASADVTFMGSIAGTALTVSSIIRGEILDGARLFGVDVTAGTTIVDQVSGTPGGVGVYTISVSQTRTSRQLSTGSQTFMQEVEASVQLDVHGPSSSDNSQIISTLFRDEYATAFFSELSTGDTISPLYADDPRQMPFLNAEAQYENRYVIEARLQANQTVTRPQQYADEAIVGLIDVDATYPP